MTPPFELSVVGAAAAIRGGRLSALALVGACLGRIDACEGEVQAWVTVDRPGALEVARQLDAETREGRFRGPLHGVPVGLKDITVSVPTGLAPDGLPLGTQLIGAPFEEAWLLGAARWVEVAIDFTGAPAL